MHCPACRHEVADGQKFCAECGARLTPALPGATTSPAHQPSRSPTALGDLFASPAAYTPKHLAEKILTSRSALEGERKQVTVMFTDVSGFTAMSERLDPEEVHGIMDRAFKVILAAVHRYEGTVNQFLGDGVMALFGAPVAHEDHANRALSAALAITRDLAPLRDEVKRVHGRDFLMRIGINTGPVVVGAIGQDLRMDYTAVGDTTNLASRLLNLAKPGQIVASRYTQHLRDGFFVFEDLGEFEVKGKSHPIRAFAVTGELRGQTRLEVSKARGLTPLVGRQPELTRLRYAEERAAAGHGTVVLVTGEPGLGKSRLLYEFVHTLEAREIVEATCLSYGSSMPYHPILDALRRHVGVTDGMAEYEIRQRLTDRLANLGLADGRALDLLGHFIGLSEPSGHLAGLPAAQLKEQTLGLLRAIFLRTSERRPLVLIVENLHWVDASSAEFLSSLAAAALHHRVLLLCTTRPGVNSAAALPVAETIALGGLDDDQRRRMVLALLGAQSGSPALLDLVLAKAEGNPLYLEEIVRQLKETDGLVIEKGHAALRAANVKVPATIHDIIAARVDRLPESLKQALQGAAVVGRQFAVDLLSRVLGTNGVLVGQLNELHALDFVFPSAAEPELAYTFKHALTQDVLYETLLVRRRRQYHGAVGAALEDLYAGRLHDGVELLAYHFARSEATEKALDYSIAAGEKAQRRWANHEALSHFETVLNTLGSQPDTPPNRLRRIDATVKQAEIKLALGRQAEQVQALEAIRSLVEEVADAPRRAAWHYWSGFLHSLTGSPPEVAIDHCREAADIADACGLAELRAHAESCLAQAYLFAGDLRGALEVGERARATFETLGNAWWASRTLFHLAPAANACGQWERSLAYCRQLLQYGLAADDLRLKAIGWWRTASAHLYRGAPDDALRCCEQALALNPTPFDATMLQAMQGYALVKVGKLDEGIPPLGQAVAWLQRSQFHYTRSVIALWLADAHLRRDDTARARELSTEVLTASRTVGYRHLEGVALRVLGEALLTTEPLTAGENLESARRILEAVGAQNDLAKTLVAQATLEEASGAREAARRLLEAALGIFDGLGTLDEPARVRSRISALGRS
jgi:class 3 adenylate cyclase/tetratricopeptide (TPR) repeat protein